MIGKKREIYIKIEKITEIVELLKNIKEQEEILRELFQKYDKINLEENKIFENWNNYMEDIVQKLDHVTL